MLTSLPTLCYIFHSVDTDTTERQHKPETSKRKTKAKKMETDTIDDNEDVVMDEME